MSIIKMISDLLRRKITIDSNESQQQINLQIFFSSLL